MLDTVAGHRHIVTAGAGRLVQARAGAGDGAVGAGAGAAVLVTQRRNGGARMGGRMRHGRRQGRRSLRGRSVVRWAAVLQQRGNGGGGDLAHRDAILQVEQLGAQDADLLDGIVVGEAGV